jgi:hypothetical protein
MGDAPGVELGSTLRSNKVSDFQRATSQYFEGVRTSLGGLT